MNIKIFYEDINFRLKGWKKIKKLIEKVISEEGNFSGDLIFILSNDRFIVKINRKYLKHNFKTDVISFNYNISRNNVGEVYISIETVKRNSINYKVSYSEEIIRVMIHGTLHICGYNDSTDKEKQEMRQKENYWLNEHKGK